MVWSKISHNQIGGKHRKERIGAKKKQGQRRQPNPAWEAIADEAIRGTSGLGCRGEQGKTPRIRGELNLKIHLEEMTDENLADKQKRIRRQPDGAHALGQALQDGRHGELGDEKKGDRNKKGDDK